MTPTQRSLETHQAGTPSGDRWRRYGGRYGLPHNSKKRLDDKLKVGIEQFIGVGQWRRKGLASNSPKQFIPALELLECKFRGVKAKLAKAAETRANEGNEKETI